MVVARGDRLSIPAELAGAVAAPGIFTTSGVGQGRAHVYVAQADGTLRSADAGSPAVAGDQLLMYCLGLGAGDSPVDGGAGRSRG